MIGQTPDWLNVSRETSEKLHFFAAEVLRWNPTVNLISKASMPQIWQRHIWDSAQIMQIAPQPNGLWIDIGSGGGFPAVVLAILGVKPMTLVESDQRKSAFLREMARQMDLPFAVVSQRVEAMPPQQAAVLSARALTALTGLLEHANRHLTADGAAIFPKGRTAQQEIEQARVDWHFDVESLPSKTDQDAAILVVKNIKPRQEKHG